MLKRLFRTPGSWSASAQSNGEGLAVLKAELIAYSKQAPVLYFIAISNAVTVAVAHHGLAPAWLTVIVPGMITVLCGSRLVFWVCSENRSQDEKQAVSTARRATIIGGLVGFVFLVWLTVLWGYGTTETRGLVNLTVGITGVAAVFGMMHVRRAAICMASAVTVPFSVFLFFQGGIPAFVATNLLLALGGVIYALMVTSSDFKKMVLAQVALSKLSEENLHLANCDTLTGLPNRRSFFLKLEELLGKSSSIGQAFAVGVLDLDGFKSVNDLNGHAVGDQLLQQVSLRLQSLTDNAAFVARLGGDEFGLIIWSRMEDEEIVAFGDRVCDALSEPFMISGLTIRISSSIGFAIHPAVESTLIGLYERADYALYHVKQHERGRTSIFNNSHEIEVRRASQIEQCLRNADLDAELSLHYQPLLNVQMHKTTAFEALARWNSPVLGNVSPGEFIPIAERTELISDITHSLLRKSLVAAKSWSDEISISFNLSMRDLMSPRSMLTIITIVRESGIDPSRIGFEVTETALMADLSQAQSSVRLLKTLGAKISLDDFGTGYSSLSHVHRFPFDMIKIDRSFISNIESTDTSRAIVRSIVDLCRSLNIGCLVEGIETPGQVRVLFGLGCVEMQGYLFSRPLPAEHVPQYLAHQGVALDQSLAMVG